MTDILITIQTLRKQLHTIFTDAAVVEVQLGQSFLTIGILWQRPGGSVREVHHRIPWSELAASPHPGVLFTDMINRLRIEFLKTTVK